MKKTVITLITMVTFFAGAQAKKTQDTIPITLPQAIDIAMSESPTIRINDKEIKRMEYSKREKYGALLPNISLSLSYMRTLKKQKMFFSFPGMPPNPNGIEVGQDNTFNGSSNGLMATVPLIAPALWASLKMTETDMALALETARKSKIDLKNQVSKAYYSILMAQDSYDVVKKTYDNALENSRIIQNKFKQGTAAEFESIRADVQVKNVEANLTATENAVELAKLQLKMLMGIDMDTPVKLQGNLMDYQKNMYGEVMKVDTSKLVNNTDLKQFDIRSKQLVHALKVQQAQWYPTLSAMFNYNYMSMVNDEDAFSKNHRWFPTSNVGVTLSIPLFQGGQRYYKEKGLKVQLDELKDQKLNLQRGLQLQAMSYVNNMQKAIKLVESNKEAMRQAEKAMQIAEKRYEVGAGTYLDVTTAQLAYMQSGFAYNQAIFDYLSAKADLEKILGE